MIQFCAFCHRGAVHVVEKEINRIPAILREISSGQMKDMRRQVLYYYYYYYYIRYYYYCNNLQRLNFTLGCIFFIVFSKHFIRCLQREFVESFFSVSSLSLYF